MKIDCYKCFINQGDGWYCEDAFLSDNVIIKDTQVQTFAGTHGTVRYLLKFMSFILNKGLKFKVVKCKIPAESKSFNESFTNSYSYMSDTIEYVEDVYTLDNPTWSEVEQILKKY